MREQPLGRQKTARAAGFGLECFLAAAMLLIGLRPRFLPLALVVAVCAAQQPEQTEDRMVESGQATVAGHSVPYRIHRLPVSSFPDLPESIAAQLDHRGCMIPQTYEAHRPENVVHASLEHAGSSDWAVLCSSQGTVSLLVFFGSAPGSAVELARAPERKRLQRFDSTGVYGFNWGIDPATAESVREAQSGPGRQSLIDHDGLADSVVDRGTRYHVYLRHEWIVVSPDS
jgi:hypothetical protein